MSEAPRSRILIIKHVEKLRSEVLLCGGIPEDKRVFDLQITTWNETISNQKASWQGQKHNKHSHGVAQNNLDTIITGGWDFYYYYYFFIQDLYSSHTQLYRM